MIRIDIEAIWRFRQDEGGASVRVMLDLLDEIRAGGKISLAAAKAQLSYRHAWNLIEKWSQFFGAPLVDRRQGRGTTLTPLGERLVWAGQRLQARLGPQIQNLCQELETEINRLLPQGPMRIRLHASHGFAVSALRDMLSRHADIQIDLRYVANQNALVSLARGACDLAGLHLPQGELRGRAIAATKGLISLRDHRVIGFVSREMGLMLKGGNPLGVHSLAALRDTGVRFVNREPESGTRRLFDQLLHQQNIEGASINGYEQVEFTHAAVAAYVASGMADACFGVEAAARQFGLDFVRLVTEDYFLVCTRQVLELESVRRLLELMQSAEFQDAIAKLPGYRLRESGRVRSVREAFRE